MNTNYDEFRQSAKQYTLVPIVETFKIDSFTPVQLFSMFKKDAFCLLESYDDDSLWSRYSFIGLHPFLTMKESKNQIQVKDDLHQSNIVVSTLQEAFSYVEDSFLIQPIQSETLPFVGGAIGYISYHYSAKQMGITLKQDNEESNVHFLYGRHYLIYDHHLQQCKIIVYVYTPTNLSETDQRNCYEKGKQTLNEFINQLGEQINERPLLLNIKQIDQVPTFYSNYSKEAFLQHIRTIKEYIASGDVFQTVLSQAFTCHTHCSGFELYRMLRKVNPSPYLFYLKYPSFELIGSSPERIIEVNHNQVEIHPIAGTRPRGNTQEDDDRLEKELLQDEKERAEHLMLVDLARNDIGAVSKHGSVHVSEFMKVTRFSHVMHIISKVKGTLKDDIHPIEALLKAAPAGTLSGAPKKSAMEIIEELEPTNRHIYGGTIAYIGFDGNIDSCIAIRTMKKVDDTVSIQAGAGIVAESKEENEFEETVNKAKALLTTVALANAYFGKKGECKDVSTAIK